MLTMTKKKSGAEAILDDVTLGVQRSPLDGLKSNEQLAMEGRAKTLTLEIVSLRSYITKIVIVGIILLGGLYAFVGWVYVQQQNNHKTGLGNGTVVCQIAQKLQISDPDTVQYCASR